MQRNLLNIARRYCATNVFKPAKCARVSFSSSASFRQEAPPAKPVDHIHRDDAGDRKTHFGFETVTEKEKEEKVYEVFHNVAQKYDLMNDVMSCGIHRLWKDHFIGRMAPVPGTRLIDVAGGTGDIAFRFIDYIRNQSSLQQVSPSVSPRQSHVTVCDINQAMLDVGKQKAAARGLDKTGSMSWVLGNAEELPVEDESYDVYTVAFGIRNMTHIDTVLSEAYRVLRPGGRFMCLEFSEVTNPLLRRAYDAYSFQVLPVMGQVVAGDWKSYQYLVESIRQFPVQEDFKEMIEDANFCNVTYENLLFGVAAIHSGFKL